MMKVWHFDTSGEAYDCTQCREEIKNGDVLLIYSEKVVGLAHTWPIAVTEECGKLHSVDDVCGLTKYCRETFGEENNLWAAKKLAAQFGWKCER